MHVSTPLRERLSPTPASESLEPGSLVGDLWAIIENADDLSSWSDELAAQSTAWPTSYFLSPARANVLRAVPLPSEGVILEIGSRAGALTRYLGEECALVDALEPDAAMAGLAAARCADLATVAVHDVWLDAVPATPTYDAIVAADVLGELAHRQITLESFLADCRARMKPSGLLVLCADNADSVRHRSGSLPPEAGIASPVRPPSLTLAELHAAATGAGLQVSIGSAFPDHRHTKVLFEHTALSAIDPKLVEVLPSFPSPPYGTPTVKPEVEGPLWSSLVAAGRAEHGANSFVALISDSAPPSLCAATYWSLGRAAALSACNRIRAEDGVAVVDRQHAFPRAPRRGGPLQLRPHVETYARGRSLVTLLAEATDHSQAEQLLKRWALLVQECGAENDAPWDLIPRNVIIDAANRMQPIDQEWELAGATVDTVLRRGVFWLAADLLSASHRPSWLRGRTLGEAADFLLRLAGQHNQHDWLELFVRDEAYATSFVSPLSNTLSRPQVERQNGRILSAISQSTPDADPASGEQASALDPPSLQAVVDSLLETNQQLRDQIQQLDRQRRHDALTQRDHSIGITAELEVMRDRVGAAQASQKLAMVKVRRLRKRVASMEASATWRIGRIFVAPWARLRGRR